MRLMNAVSLGAYTSGMLTANFNFGITNNDMQIFYGTTNVAAGTGVLIYDTGNTNGAGSIALPFGPVAGLTANLITIVMNQGGNTQWSGVMVVFRDDHPELGNHRRRAI